MTDPGHVPLTNEDQLNLEAARAWLKGHFSENEDLKYEPIAGKLRLLEAILASRWVEPSETWKLQALGICLGDALAQELLMDWVIVDDEYSRSPALNWPGTTIYTFPQTLISKRIERGEIVDVKVLFESVAEAVRQMAFSGRYA